MNINNTNKNLRNYIISNIFKEYAKNDTGHQIDHIINVINRSFELTKDIENLNADIIYTSASFHDIGIHISRRNHHIESAKIFMNDEYMNEYFKLNELYLIKEAIEDHRASLNGEPRNIYGKILSSADRDIDLDNFIYRAYMAAKKNNSIKNNGSKSNFPLTHDELVEAVYEHLIDKFGKEGYAKVYYIDDKYTDFINETNYLIDNKGEYLKRVKRIIKE